MHETMTMMVFRSNNDDVGNEVLSTTAALAVATLWCFKANSLVSDEALK